MPKFQRKYSLLRIIGAATVEQFERRLLMSTYTVNTLSDAATPVAGQLTFRQAVADANADAGPDTVTFSPTVFSPGSLQSITLLNGPIVFTDTTGTTTVTGPLMEIKAAESSKSPAASLCPSAG